MKLLITALFLVFSSFLYSSWAEKTLDTMTREEKVGQLFVISISPPRGTEHFIQLRQFLKKYPIGGVLLKQAHPLEQVVFLNAIQASSKCPLLTLIDAEWGLGMRMQDTLSYPRNLTLGAVQDIELLREMGRQIGQQCRLVGAHLNLAPVVDVNTNLNNPVLHQRAFGDDPYQVALRATALLQGMQDEGIFASVKHFPGHGDTAIDSHQDLPLIPHTLDRLKTVEFVPFSQAIASGTRCVMSAHLFIPEIDQVPCTFSRALITEMLQTELGFKGLVITDALNMKALTNYFEPGEIGLKAFLAGHHLLLYGSHKDEIVDTILNEFVPKAFKTILYADIPEKVLNERVLTILQAKERLGLHENRFLPEREDLMAALHDTTFYELNARLFAEAVTVYREEGFPAFNEKIAYLQVGREEITPFFTDLQETFDVTPFLYGTECSVKEFDRVILALYQSELPKELRALDNVLTVVFTTPYALKTCPKKGTVIVAYEGVREAEKVASDVLKGRRKAKGKLPIKL